MSSLHMYHVIPVDPILTVEEAWKELCTNGMRMTYTSDDISWATVPCDGTECDKILLDPGWDIE